MLEIFTPYTNNNLEKIRIGSNNDGGYVIYKNCENYDIILSGGAGNNITFEIQLIELYPNTICHLFDHTVDLKIENSNIIFYKLKLDKSNIKFFDMIRSHNNIFLKLDIEGWEYELLTVLDHNDMERIKQIVIEIHSPFTDQKLNLVKKLLHHHTLIHLHANNCCPFTVYDGVNIPRVIELSLVRTKDLPSDLILYKNTTQLPLEIDQPNLKNKPDFQLNHYPFVIEQ
jgi:hypothetical protein